MASVGALAFVQGSLPERAELNNTWLCASLRNLLLAVVSLPGFPGAPESISPVLLCAAGIAIPRTLALLLAGCFVPEVTIFCGLGRWPWVSGGVWSWSWILVLLLAP